VGQQTLEIDLPVHPFIQKQIEEGVAMTTLRMCELGQVSRAGLYRFAPEAETPTRISTCGTGSKHCPKVPLQRPAAHYRRIEAARWKVNYKRVGRIMRVDNLLRLRRRKFVVTTDSKDLSRNNISI
jgi:hypothetical protein